MSFGYNGDNQPPHSIAMRSQWNNSCEMPGTGPNHCKPQQVVAIVLLVILWRKAQPCLEVISRALQGQQLQPLCLKGPSRPDTPEQGDVFRAGDPPGASQAPGWGGLPDRMLQCSMRAKSTSSAAGPLGSNPSPATYLLCDLRPITSPPWV